VEHDRQGVGASADRAVQDLVSQHGITYPGTAGSIAVPDGLLRSLIESIAADEEVVRCL
jgi:hypothetical protein